jgi:hypothetical protein
MKFGLYMGVGLCVVAAAANAQEVAGKKAASLPGALQDFKALDGMTPTGQLERRAVPQVWLKRLQAHQAAGRNLILPAPLPAQAVLVVGPTWYSFKWLQDGRHVVLMVHYKGFSLAGAPVLEQEADELVIGRAHGLVSATVHLAGAAVSVDVECSPVVKDTACFEDAYVRGVVARLAVLP